MKALEHEFQVQEIIYDLQILFDRHKFDATNPSRRGLLISLGNTGEPGSRWISPHQHRDLAVNRDRDIGIRPRHQDRPMRMFSNTILRALRAGFRSSLASISERVLAR